MFRLETERLLMRPWEPGDRALLAAIVSDPEVMRYIGRGASWGDEEVDEFLGRQARNLDLEGVCMGAAVDRGSGQILGISGIQPLGTTGELEIGWIFSKQAWGKGYATEAGRAARRHVIETLKRPRVVAIIDPDNAPSKAVAARLGMQYDGRYTGAQLGHRRPEIVVDLFAYPPLAAS